MQENKKNYGSLSTFYGVLSAIAAALSGYHIYFIRFFKKEGQFYTRTANFTLFKIGNETVRKIADALHGKLYDYYDMWAKIFGKYPTTKVLAILLPVTFILGLISIYYLIMHINKKKPDKKTEEAAENEQQPIQG